MAATAQGGEVPRPDDGRWIAGAAVACATAMLAWMGRALITGEIPFTGDLLHFHYPLRDFYARALAAGWSFDWMPGLFNGFYVVGEGQLGAYHPVHWLLYRVLPLDRAFAIELVLAYPALFIGTWWWLRPKAGTGPAAFGALAATFSGFTLTHGVHPNVVGVLAHLPWLLLTIDRVPGARRVAAIALLTGSQLLLGHPQSVWFSLLAGVAYAGGRAAADPMGRGSRVAGAWIAGVLLGALVGAVQLLTTLDAWQHSTRPAFDAAYATAFSIRPLHLLQLLHPYLFWGRASRWNEAPGAGDEFGIYGGGVVLLLAVWWLAESMRAVRKGAAAGEPVAAYRFGWCVAAFGLIGLWLSTGSYGGVYLVQTWLPLVSGFRAPVRYIVFTQWALAVLAALALARLLRRPADDRAGRLALLATIALAVGTAWLLPMPVPADATEVLVARWSGPAVLIVAGALVTWAARGARLPLVALVVLAAADLSAYGLRGVVAWQDFVSREQALGYLDPDKVLDGPPAGRLARGGFPNLYLLADYRLVDGYVAIEPARQLDYRTLPALRLSQAAFANDDHFQGVEPPAGGQLGRGWIAVPAPLPRARLMAEALVSAAPQRDLDAIDIDRAALVTHGLSLLAGSPGSARIVADRPGEIVVVTTAPAPRLLVLSESFNRGWVVDVDGTAAGVERVNGDFLGAVVPGGSHTATFQFRPRHLLVGKAVSVLGVLVAGGLALRKRKP